MWLPFLNRSNPKLSTLLHLREVRQHKSVNKILYHPGDAQKNNWLSMFSQSLSMDSLSAAVLLKTHTIAIRRVLSLIMFVHIHVHKCFFLGQTAWFLPWCGASGLRKAVFMLAYMLHTPLGASHELIYEFMVVQNGCGFDLGQHQTVCLVLLKQNYPHCFFITHMVHLLYCNYPLLFYLAYFKQY